jgi:hypothetical protein
MHLTSNSVRAGVFLLLVLLLLPAPTNAQEDTAALVLERINRARAEASLPALARNPLLDTAAQGHANDLLQNGSRLGHRGSDGSNIQQRVARAGFDGDAVGENWASYRSIDLIMEFWLTDPPHRRNILNGKYREVGIGVALRPNGGLIIVTDFGGRTAKSESAPPPATPVPEQIAATPAPTRAKLKPTAVPPTPKPTRIPTLSPTQAPTIPPPPVTLVAVAQNKIAHTAFHLRVRGKVPRLTPGGTGTVTIGLLPVENSFSHEWAGSVIMVSGALLVGMAVMGHRRYSSRR